MGSKFGNFSIADTSIEDTAKLLESYPQNLMTGKFLESAIKLLTKDAKLPTAEQHNFVESLVQISDLAKRTFFIGIRGKWTTVYSEDFFVGSEIDVIPLSKKIDKTFVVAEVFDDDIFGIAIIKNGEILTRHVSGDTDVWKMTPKKGNLEIIAETFGITDKRKVLEVVLDSEDVPEKVMALEELLNIFLWTVGREQVLAMGWKEVEIPAKKKSKPDLTSIKQALNHKKSSPLATAWEEFESTPPWKYRIEILWETEIGRASGASAYLIGENSGKATLLEGRDLILAYNHAEDDHGFRSKGRLTKLIDGKIFDFFEAEEAIQKPALGNNGEIYVETSGVSHGERRSDTALYRVETGGKVAWRFQLSGTNETKPVIDDDSIYVYDFQTPGPRRVIGHLYRIRNSGELVWQLPFESIITTDPVIMGKKDNKRIIFGLRHLHSLVAVDLQGNKIVEISDDAAETKGHGDPYLVADALFTSTDHLMHLNENLDILWKYKPAKGFVHGEPLVDPLKNTYGYATYNQFYSLDQQGKERWIVTIDGYPILQPTLLNNGDILIATQTAPPKHVRSGDIDSYTKFQIFTNSGQKLFEHTLPGSLFHVWLGKNNKFVVGLDWRRNYPKEERSEVSVKIFCLELTANES